MLKPSLADTLQNVISHLSPKIATNKAVIYLENLAKLSAPIPRAGFEIRLSEEISQVDLQQGILFHNNEHKVLINHIESLVLSNLEFDQFVWQRIYKFCKAWDDFNSVISELWLEFDLDESNPEQKTPSIFIGIDRNLINPQENLNIIKTALEIFNGKPLNESLLGKLKLCFRKCESPVRITHIGIMLSRQKEQLRINVSRISPYKISHYLQEVGYPNSTDEIKNLVNQLLDTFDNVKICLDIGHEIHSQIGLECFFSQQSGVEPRLLPFLDDLIEKKLCTPEKRDALVRDWVGYTIPTGSTKPWASYLMAESLLQPKESLGILDRRLSHIKLTYRPQHPLEVKAYIGFVHQWLKTESVEQNNQAQNIINFHDKVFSGTSGALNQSQLNHAIETATDFLLNSSNQKGWWHDFNIDIRRNRSDEWVTAYIAVILSSLPHKKAIQAAKHAWTLLLSRRPFSPGWGYNEFAPPDADSTTWVLRLAIALGENNTQRVKAASQFLMKHLSSCGGIACYLKESLGVAAKSGLRPVEGWCRVHPCITATVACLEDFKAPCIDFLRNTQQKNGSWKAYWWYDNEYVTALAAEALALDNDPRNDRQVQLAIEWAASRISSCGAVYSPWQGDNSAFATAWCVRTLTLAKEKQDVRAKLHKSVNWLINTQKVDGSWNSSALMRHPDPSDVLDPDNSPMRAIIPDDKRLFTTATVLGALSIAQTSFLP